MLPDLPGWDSLPAVSRYHSVAEIAGIIVLAALVVAEVVAYKYGKRKDFLTEHQQQATEQRHDKEMAQLHLDAAKANADATSARADIATADARAAGASQKAAEAQLALEILKRPRTLTLARVQFVSTETAKFGGQRYRASVSQAADDGIEFWQSIYAALKLAGWSYIPMPPGQPAVGNPAAGIPIVTMPGVEILFDPTKERELGPAALALGNALHADGTVVAVNKDNPRNAPDEADVILIRIGVRVPPK
jgi:hypothetical protein